MEVPLDLLIIVLVVVELMAEEEDLGMVVKVVKLEGMEDIMVVEEVEELVLVKKQTIMEDPEVMEDIMVVEGVEEVLDQQVA